MVGAPRGLAEAVRSDLEGMGIGVETLDTSREMADRLIALGPQIGVLFHEPPRSQAFDSLRTIRGERALETLPVLVVGRDEGGELDAIVAFELGTDDYVRIGAGSREIALRARAVLRRGNTGRQNDGSTLSAGPIEIDVSRHIVHVDGVVVELTALEFRLLVELARHRGRVVKRQELLERVWQLETDAATRTVDTHVKRLREKLGSARRCVETIRGVGYRMRVTS